MAPSLTIWPAMVHTMPADTPDRRRARAKMVPTAGEMLFASRSWMPKMSASNASGFLYSEAPATMRMAELTKRANVNRARASSVMEYLRECLMAASDGMYVALSWKSSWESEDEEETGSSGKRPCLVSYSRSLGWTMPEPRYKL